MDRQEVDERWGRLREYADQLESAGTISSMTKYRLLQVFSRLLLYQTLEKEITSREQCFTAKVDKFEVRLARKIR